MKSNEEIFPCSRIGRFKNGKMRVLPNLIYKFNATPIEISALFCDLAKLILKFMWRGKIPRIANTLLKKNKIEGLMLPNFMASYIGTIIKAV